MTGEAYEILTVYFGSRNTDSALPVHTHPYWQLEIATHGMLGATYLDQQLELAPGDMLLVPPEAAHSFRYQESGVSWITLKFECVKKRGSEEQWGGVIRSSPFTGRLVSALQTAIVGTAVKPYELAFVSGCLDAVFAYVRSDEAHAPHNAASLLVGRVEEMIAERSGRAITIEELAQAVGYSRSHLSKTFSDAAGIGLKAYIDKTRMRIIEERMRYLEDSISEIAADLGFADLFAFSKFFKKHAGCSPTTYRRRSRGEEWRDDAN